MYAKFQKAAHVGLRKRLNIVYPKDAIRIDRVRFKSGIYDHFVFLCKHFGCDKEVKVRSNHIPFITGKCKKHANMHLPFEANYGAARRSARERKLEFKLTYEQYLKFTKINNCHYCNEWIQWTPFNEHGKNNPGFKLDRQDNKKGYTTTNCVVCCTTCNWAKRSMSVTDFVNMCKRVAEHYTT